MNFEINLRDALQLLSPLGGTALFILGLVFADAWCGKQSHRRR